MKKLREKLGLTTADVASKVGVSDSTVRNWESGRTEPRLTLNQLILLCDLYGVNLKELSEAVQSTFENNKTKNHA